VEWSTINSGSDETFCFMFSAIDLIILHSLLMLITKENGCLAHNTISHRIYPLFEEDSTSVTSRMCDGI
jgi:hypothetical protein